MALKQKLVSLLFTAASIFLLIKNICWSRTLKKPFSYTGPAHGFPADVFITDMNGKAVKQLADLPSAETAPSGNDNVQIVPRGFDWRDDEAGHCYMVHAIGQWFY